MHEKDSIDEAAELLAAKGYILYFTQTPVPEYTLPWFILLQEDVCPEIASKALDELIQTGQIVCQNETLQATEKF